MVAGEILENRANRLAKIFRTVDIFNEPHLEGMQPFKGRDLCAN